MNHKYLGTVINHDGGTPTFFSDMTALYDHKLGVVVLTNSVEGSEAVNKISMEALESLFEAKAGRKLPKPDELPPVAHLDELKAARYSGTYDSVMGLVTISPWGDKLHVKTPAGSFQLIPRQDGTFSLKYLLAGFIPLTIDEKPLDKLCFSFREISGYQALVGHSGDTDRKQFLFGTRLSAPEIPESWTHRLGKYENTDHEDEGITLKCVKLKMQDGYLLADVTVRDVREDTASFALNPINETEAIVMGLGRNRGITCRVINRQGEEYLHIMGYDLRPVKK